MNTGPDFLDQLTAQARGAEHISDESRAAIWSQIEATLGVPPPVPTGAEASAGAGGGATVVPAATTAVGGVKALAAAVGIAAVTWVAVEGPETPRAPVEAPVSIVQTYSQRDEPAARADETDVAEPEAKVPEAVDPPAPAAPSAARTKRAKTSRPRGMAAELALLRPARAALRRGDHDRAIRLLKRHAKRFPDSALAEGRTADLARAHCEAGRHRAGRQALAELVAKWPGTPAATAVKRACLE